MARPMATRWVCWLALLALSCTAPPSPESAGAQAKSSGLAFRETPLGLCEDYPPESTTPERLVRDFRLLQSLGARVLRVSFGWDDIEPSPGHYVFDDTDRFVDLAVGKYGLELVPYVAYTPGWAASDPGENGWKSPPRDAERFGALLRELARRYAGRIESWEIWNEPDNADFFSGDAGDYAQLLAAGSRGVRSGNPRARVVFGGLADDLVFLRTLFVEHGAAPLVDVVNLHRYAETWSDDSLESIPSFIGGAREIVDRFGEREPLWMAEVGYSSFRRGARVSEWFEAVYDYEHTPEFQAVALARIVTLALATEELSLLAWYEISDLPMQGEVIGDVNNRHLGVLTAEGVPKPALAAFRAVRRLFDGGLRAVRPTLSVSGVDRSELEVHAFQREDGSLLAAAWLKTLTTARAKAAAGRDQRRATLSITVPVRAPSRAQVELFDAKGQALIREVGLRSERTTTALERLELRGGEIVFISLDRR
jgi:polysaccharide biosynthesis protein PslG